MNQTQAYYQKAKKLIPGGVQLLSKRPEQFAPGQWPGYAARAKGCEVWDLDGKHYYDMTTNGIGACLLGYADPDVDRAVMERIANGSMSTLNVPEEVRLAEKLLEIHPWAENVRFARTGGEICAVAIRIARATTGRDVVAFCGYHGWSDWYLAANLGSEDALDGQLLPGLSPVGVPRGLQQTAVTFHYNDTAGFDALLQQYGDRLACVIMEPVRHHVPEPGFLEHVRDGIHRAGGLLIFDEITIGWRLTFGGSHKMLGVEPDMATFAKALGNGYPIAAVIGTKAAMEGAHISFISSTYWTEGVGFAAALAAIDKMERTLVWEHAAEVGATVRQDWETAARRHDVPVVVGTGFPCIADFRFAEYPLELKTLFTAWMLKEGFLANNAIYPTLAHNDEILSWHREVLDRVFEKIGETLRDGDEERIRQAIGGPVCQSGFARLVD